MPVKNDFGQYFTPRHIADLMVGMIKSERTAEVLEPSSGEGVFLDALYDQGFTNAQGYEIDERLTHNPAHKVTHRSFVSVSEASLFDVVIGNPPYIRWKNLTPELREEMQDHPLWGTLFNSLSDYLTVFIANSVTHLTPGGELIFITPSFWMHTSHSLKLREWMLQHGHISDVVDFGESKVFDGVSSAIIIFRFVKSASESDSFNYHRYIGPRAVPTTINLGNQYFETHSAPTFKRGKHWTLAPAKTQEEANRLELAATLGSQTPHSLLDGNQPDTLGNYVEIANGMVSGLDKAFRLSPEEYESLPQEELTGVSFVAKAKDLGHLKNLGITPYIDVPEGMSERDFNNAFPQISAKLAFFKEALDKRYSYGRSLPYWEWAFKRSQKLFYTDRPKIFTPCKERMTNKDTARFAYVEGGILATQDVTAIIPTPNTRESIEYILGYLSTKQVSDWFRVRGLMKGGIAEFSEKPLMNIPFLPIDWDSESSISFHNHITNAVKEILSKKKASDPCTLQWLSTQFEEQISHINATHQELS
ncbi:hypothetical protein HMPREF2617_04810 [Corynebacterium sp. HMSC070H05]|uniref:Eco57I restriction-modification methylase domain-containing protein n=1 Tax=unclassified Corynebacterium TaxID=2624378 RepID=UPI000917A65C|nr:MULTISPECIES: Eco57I restriction-modification methylase domain-containing protein [unclassified Corynebacterium]OHQ56301.1 hypothetical protein HMPREF2617_04810 [Corynebacterium sp. HMSC070H05]